LAPIPKGGYAPALLEEATMRWMTLAGLASTLLLINCGGDYCSNMESFEANAAARNGSCNGGTSVATNFSQSA
jgi:hypothetical protein